MKKILSLLSVLTITGTVVPNVIAVSSYQIEETIKNSSIDYKQINNLEKLIRIKRNFNSQTTATKIMNINNNFTKTNIVDSRGNIYSIKNYFRPYVLKKGENTPTKIDGVGTFAKTTNLNIVVDNKDNIYFGNDTGAYVLKIKYDKKIKFLGFYDNYKGEFGLDTDDKKIIFFGNNELFHSWLQERQESRIYNKIIIKTIDNKIIKEIIINVGNSMKDVINNYNLKNGISYENGYIIEI